MSVTKKRDSNINVKSITFSDGSVLASARNTTNDFNVRKRLKVSNDTELEGDVTIRGNLKVYGDSILTTNGVTHSELHTAITNSENRDSSRFLIAHEANSFFKQFPSDEKYSQTVTTLSNDSFFIIPDASTLKIRTSPSSSAPSNIGKFLKCFDNDGTCIWSTVDNIEASELNNIITNFGITSDSMTGFNFKVVDTGPTGTSNQRGLFFYCNMVPSKVTNGFSIGDPESVILALGGGTKDYTLPTSTGNRIPLYLAPFSKGSEAIEFLPAYSDDPYSGRIRISAGAFQESDQFISLEKEGVKIKLRTELNATHKILTSSTFDGLLHYDNFPRVHGINSDYYPNSNYIKFESDGNLLIKPINNSENDARHEGNVLSIHNGHTMWRPLTNITFPADLFNPIHGVVPTDTRNHKTYRTISTIEDITAGYYIVTYNICLAPNSVNLKFLRIYLFLSDTYEGNTTKKIKNTPLYTGGSGSITYNILEPDFMNITNSFTMVINPHSYSGNNQNNVHTLPPGETTMDLYLNIYVNTNANTNDKEYKIYGDYSHFTLIKIREL